jgi:hypothetical protein
LARPFVVVRAIRRPARERGLATLVVVMALFFIVSLVAAYTSRNLIFEQRTSANQYRATQAFEAAEAGVEWALSMLNGGRIDDDCLPTADTTRTTFRERYFAPIAPDGTLTLRTRTGSPPNRPLMPACLFDADTGQWRCNCPSDAAPVLPALTNAAAQPMFRIRFEFIPLAESTRRDVVRIVSAGCTRPDPACLAEDPSAPSGDALSVVTALIALRSGLTTPPGAPVVARGSIDAGAGPLRATNTDVATGGVTLIAGGAISGSPVLTSLPGTPGAVSTVENDIALASLVDVAAFTVADRMFASVFGMLPGTYSQQPATLRLDCSATCTSTAVNDVVAANPGRVVWLDGDLTVDSDIGTPSAPALIVVTGNAALSSGNVQGLLYGRAVNWDRGAGTTLISGALVAEGNLGGSGAQSVVYDSALLNQMRTQHGSFVRVPGGWRDFR